MRFDERDVVRHNLVQQIIKAYDEFGAVRNVRGSSTAASAMPPPPAEAVAAEAPPQLKNEAAR